MDCMIMTPSRFMGVMMILSGVVGLALTALYAIVVIAHENFKKSNPKPIKIVKRI